MQISIEHANSVCLIGKGERTCSFFSIGPDGLECLKGTSFAAVIRARQKMGTMNAKGDNCSGPPNFLPHSLDEFDEPNIIVFPGSRKPK